MSNLSEWLDRHGLGKHAELFADNDIDLDVVPELTDADLEKLGVSLGDRRRFLKAATSLDVSTQSQPSDMPGAETRDAERRQITVMFVDLVGSTELSTKLDSEDMREVIGAYHKAVAAEVERFDGHVAKYLGDGVLAYFGWPKAHEDEAERAVRTGIAITAAVTAVKLPGNQPLSARVGIATGLVVVGDLVGKAEAREHAVVVDTPNLAARLQALSEPGQVVIGDNTRQLLGDLFELADLGNHELKGFEAPVQIWRVVGESSVANRFEAMHGSALAPLVGRDQELALLTERWLRATESEGQVVLLSGEPGIGKSRLMRALCDHLIDEPHTRLNYFCSAYQTNSALHPVIGQLERAAEIMAADEPKTRLGKLEGLLGRAFSDVASVAPLFAALLSIDGGERYPPIKLNPEVQKARTFEVLIAQIEALANRSPVLAILEDAHWLDPTLSELFSVLIDRIQGLKVLLIVTFRPEFVPPWVGHAHVTSLSLNRLGGRQVRKIIESITYGKSVPREIEEQIAAKTDGVPLFVEELTKTVLESGLLHEVGGAFVLDGPLPPLAVPTTLHDSLMARLDRRAPIREIAQIGAVIGREFSYDLLATLTGGSPIALDDALAQLADAAIAVCREFKFSYYLAWATIIRGWSLQSEDNEDQAITQMRAGLDALRTTGARLREPYYLGLLAEASRRTGQYEEGLELAASALESAGKSGERFYDAELYRTQGELLLRKSAQTQGESSMRQALKIARSQKARAYELRAATSLARNLRDKGMLGEADRILAPVYGSFTEGFDTAELKEAKALL